MTAIALDNAYLPLKVLAQYAGLSVRTLRGYLHNPVTPLPHYRVGGKILVRRSDYDGWALRFRQSGVSTLHAIVDDVLRGL